MSCEKLRDGIGHAALVVGGVWHGIVTGALLGVRCYINDTLSIHSDPSEFWFRILPQTCRKYDTIYTI